MGYDEIILKHYAEEAARSKDAPHSTMQDPYVRQREVSAITTVLKEITVRMNNDAIRVLEIGCGNGYLLSQLVPLFPRMNFSAVEFSPELLAIAQERTLAGTQIKSGDCRQLAFPDRSFDAVIGERVLINLLDRNDQKQAIKEIARVLCPRGFYLMIEGFLEPHQMLNQAREELGMSPIPVPSHNLYFSESILKDMEPVGFFSQGLGIQPNFLSTHYFISRVLHACIRCENAKIYGTRFVDFFDSAFPPDIGNYAAIKFYSLQKC